MNKYKNKLVKEILKAQEEMSGCKVGETDDFNWEIGLIKVRLEILVAEMPEDWNKVRFFYERRYKATILMMGLDLLAFDKRTEDEIKELKVVKNSVGRVYRKADNKYKLYYNEDKKWREMVAKHNNKGEDMPVIERLINKVFNFFKRRK